jgi:hypothetical protein
MIGRRAVLGLSLLSALVFCALAAQGASAAEAKNTTAVTCVEKAKGFFEDAHCDTKLPTPTGNFEHVAIELNTETEIHVTNEKTAEKTTQSTPVTTKLVFGGVEVHVECTKVVTDTKNKSFIRNTEPITKEHKVDGTIAVIFEGCTVKKPANCTIKSITFAAKFVGVEELGPNHDTHGLEFKPDGVAFSSKVLEGEKCPLKGKAIEITGSMIATGTPSPKEKHSGATWIFEPGNEMQKLEAGGKAAEFKATLTPSMVNSEGKTENPIALTTTT